MRNSALRILVGLAGAGVVAAATYANILYAGGFGAKETPLIIAIAALLTIGMAFAVTSWTEGRRLHAAVFGACLLSGEVYWALSNAEREVADRENRAHPIVEQRQTKARAAKRVTDAKAALAAVPETSPRLVAALQAKADADGAAIAKSAEMGCRKNCSDLLQGQVNNAQRDVDEARAELTLAKAAAEKELADANADLARLPDPPSANALPDRIGMEAWSWDLLLAGLRTAAVIGGSLAIGLALHPRRQKSDTSRTAAQEIAAARAQRIEAARPSTNAIEMRAKREHVSKFLESTLQPDPAASISLKALVDLYPGWCKGTPLPMSELGDEMQSIFKALGLSCETRGRDILVHGARFIQALEAPRSSAA